jgi:hypothetical protein
MKYVGEKRQDALGQTVQTNREIAKELNLTPVLGKIQEYVRLQHKKITPPDRLPIILKYYRPKDRRNQGRPRKRILVA